MQVGGGAKRGPSEEGRAWRNRLIGQMVTEIISEAKAGHFAGLVPVILPLLDGRSSHRNGTTGDPNEKVHPVVNSTLQVVCMQIVSTTNAVVCPVVRRDRQRREAYLGRRITLAGSSYRLLIRGASTSAEPTCLMTS